MLIYLNIFPFIQFKYGVVVDGRTVVLDRITQVENVGHGSLLLIDLPSHYL